MAESYYAKQYKACAASAKKPLMNLTFPDINFNKNPTYPLNRSSFPCCLERYFLLTIGSGTVPGAEIGNYFCIMYVTSNSHKYRQGLGLQGAA